MNGPAEVDERIVLLFAHRGASKDYREHTRAAYLEAIAQGADGLETDVRLTADGQLVCWHDATTDRVGGAAGYVHERTLAQMRDLDLVQGADVPSTHGAADEQLMTLVDLLEVMLRAERPLRLALEIKQPSPFGSAVEEAVFRDLEALGWDAATGRLGSISIDLMCFWPATVESLLTRLDPKLVMLLLEDAAEDDLVTWVEHETGGRSTGDEALAAVRTAGRIRDRLLDVSEVGVGPDKRIVKSSPALVETWAATRRVRVWTVDTVEDAERCIATGVRELTTNVPGRLRSELED
ncbi:glycerophosphodiester phosphodiesterase [Amnibacterium flavum]|uniref:Glycerophosphodiester phosphodiesterase n=1 Tax=Amnibacterium flavum TaxID=2173173 RepID=A0A2V1HTV8_9MICO|nr:glycerophosphodiester phosphodiesterase family protein [Amnibacterium flavum]PVZ96003.1 glycerophosphodiester phosphodiesterase [Amnibacterium flavum]